MMEGYLYYVHSHKLRLNHPRKRYVVLVGNRASSYKDKPASKDEVGTKSRGEKHTHAHGYSL